MYDNFYEICHHQKFWYIFNLWDILFTNDMVSWYKRHRISKRTTMTMVCRGDAGVELKMKSLIQELNKIVAEMMKPNWYWMCMFCGKHSSNGKWMEDHIISHCKSMCKENGDEDYYGLLEGEWEEHTITVDPNLDGVRAGYRYLGFYPLIKEKNQKC